MAITKNISYHSIQTDHVDEAASLASYLNEHGVVAQHSADAVDLAVPDVDTFTRVEMLKLTWALFWENSDSGVLGLPIYVKE
jgi:hypothetical protein